MSTIQLFAFACLICCMYFSNAAPVANGQSYYKVVVTFKKPLDKDDKDTILKTMSLLATNPITVNNRVARLSPPTFPTTMTGEVQLIITGPSLSDSDKDSVSKYASSLIDSYLTRHGNGAANVAVNDVDPTVARLHDEMPDDIDNNVDISS